MSRLELGVIAKDKITGFTGVIVAHTKWLSNCDRFTLQPRELKDGKPLNSRSFDEGGLEFVEPTDLRVLAPSRPKEPVSLGDEVKHEITGLTGVAVAMTFWLEGCVYVSVQPKLLKDGEPVDTSTLDERSLTVTKAANPKPAKVKTGGPRPEPVR